MTQNPRMNECTICHMNKYAKCSAHLFFMDNSKNSMTKEKLYIVDVQAEVGHSGNINVFSDVENRVASTPTGVNKVLLQNS